MRQFQKWLGGQVAIVPAFVMVTVVSIIVLSVIVYCLATGERFHDFARDPALTYQYPPLGGLLSHTGGLLWAGAAAISLTGAWLLRQIGAEKQEYRCFFAVGLLNLLLMVDDLFVIHEEIGPFVLGIREEVFLTLYMALAVTWGLVYRRVLLGRPWGMLALAVMTFVLAVGLDLFWPFERLQFVLEDTAKLLGIALWAAYFAATLTDRVQARLPAAAPATRGFAPSRSPASNFPGHEEPAPVASSTPASQTNSLGHTAARQVNHQPR